LTNDVHRMRGLAALGWLDLSQLAGPPIDSVQARIKRRAQQLVHTVAWETVRGLQAAAGIVLLIRAGDTARATKLVERRLAERGLSLTDSAFVLFTAANAYARYAWPGDLTRAAHYTKRLDALPTGNDYWKAGAGFWQAKMHITLGIRHYYLGHIEEVFAELDRFTTLLARMDYLTREGLIDSPMTPNDSPEIARFIDLYRGALDMSQTMPDGAERMAAINKRLLEVGSVPAPLVAMDTGAARNKAGIQWVMKYDFDALMWYWKKVPPLPGKVWLNTADTTARDVTFGDGNVYVVEHTIFCTNVPEVAKRLERLQAAVPGVKVYMRCMLSGHWGNVFVTPAQELAAIRAKFAAELRSSIPVSVWVSDKQRTRDNGFIPPPDPSGRTVFASGQYVLFIDKQGRLRPLIAEPIEGPGEYEHRQILLLRRLMAEPAVSSSTTRASTTLTASGS
jgi:hypothetical protein